MLPEDLCLVVVEERKRTILLRGPLCVLSAQTKRRINEFFFLFVLIFFKELCRTLKLVGQRSKMRGAEREVLLSSLWCLLT